MTYILFFSIFSLPQIYAQPGMGEAENMEMHCSITVNWGSNSTQHTERKIVKDFEVVAGGTGPFTISELPRYNDTYLILYPSLDLNADSYCIKVVEKRKENEKILEESCGDWKEPVSLFHLSRYKGNLATTCLARMAFVKIDNSSDRESAEKRNRIPAFWQGFIEGLLGEEKSSTSKE